MFPLERAFLIIIESLCFSLAFLGLPLFQFLFLCLSLVLFFLSSFLSSFFALFCFLVFLSFFDLFLSSLLLFHERNNIKTLNCNYFSSIRCLFCFLSWFLFAIPFSYLCCFLIFSYVFCSTSMLLVSKNTSWKKHQLLVKRGGGATKRCLYNLCFVNLQSYRFLGGGNLWLMFKKHYKMGISAHFQKKKITIFKGYLGGHVKASSGAKFGAT